MSIKSSDLKYIATQIANTVYTEITAEASYSSVEIAAIAYEQVESTDLKLDHDPKHKIIRDLADLIDQSLFELSKATVDTATASDTSRYAILKTFADNVTDILDTTQIAVVKRFEDPAVLTDFLTYTLDVQFNDYFVLTDSSTWELRLDKQDTFTLPDVFTRVVQYVRTFQDYVTIDDLSSIDKFFDANKRNIAAVTDESVWEVVKTFFDNVSTEDHSVFVAHKILQDFASVTELLVTNIEKSVADIQEVQDLVSLIATKPFSDITDVDDQSVLSYGKIVTDLMSTGDIFTRVAQFVRNFTDIAVISDVSQKLFGKGINDYPVVLDHTFTTTSKILADISTTVDLSTMDLGKEVTDTTTTLDTSYTLVSKGLSEIIPLLDSVILAFGAQYDDIASTIDYTTINSTKPFNDTVSHSDVAVRELGKGISDTVGFVDSLVYDLSFDLEDVAFVLDTPAILVSRSLQDSTGISDVVNYAVDYQRTFSDTVAIDDVVGVPRYIDSNKFNIATPLDFLSFSQDKILSDALTIGDVPAIIYTKPFTDDTYSVADYTDWQVMKNISEVLSVMDTITVVRISGGSSIFNASAFNNSTFG